MTSDSLYKTIEKRSEALYKEKGSKFFAYALPLEHPVGIAKAIEGLKQEHPKARHFCYGAVTGSDGLWERSNDDGEPSNSAGMPILNQLRSSELTNILVVVVRYFGGTKLGVPGLIRAYKTATQAALECNQIVERTVTLCCRINFEYEHMDSVMRLARIYNWNVVDQKFELTCWIKVSLHPQQKGTFEGQIQPILKHTKLQWSEIEK